MINLPVFEILDVDEYGMYPGTSRRPGLHVQFKSGLTLVLGANGLGKTTLVNILYRMVSGPTDIPTLEVGGELGDRRLDAKTLSPRDRRVFANRVADDASEAVATLTFTLGATRIVASRSLENLELLTLLVDGVHQEAVEAEFQRLIIREAGLFSFGDWILALRHLIFYFEDRRALVWDATAQRQLLRLLFLQPEESREWRRREREILELDSSVRNFQYMLNREARVAAKTDKAVGSAAEVRQQLRLLEVLQEKEQERLAELNDDLVAAAADRQTARVNALTAEQAYETAVRNVERLQLHALEAEFPSASETGRYILGHILADEECLTCGTHVPELAEQIRQRIASSKCPVCGTMLEGNGRHGHRAARGLVKATKTAQAAEIQKMTLMDQRMTAEKAYDELIDEVSILTESTARRAKEINGLIRRLPPDEQQVHKQRSGFLMLQTRLEQQKADLADLRRSFEGFVDDVNETISERRDAIKAEFDAFATGFLLEQCRLKWSPQKGRVGQTGSLVEFAAFELEMTGSDYASPLRRTGPSQVSESQREFIDLSFRMALMLVASASGGSLVVDAPESSLDAVFVKRAADVLTQFGQAHDSNRLVITSNLVDGNLIPELLRQASVSSSRDRRVVDLLKIATPTAATRALAKEYDATKKSIFARASGEKV